MPIPQARLAASAPFDLAALDEFSQKITPDGKKTETVLASELIAQ